MSYTILEQDGRKVYIRTAKPEHKLRKPEGWAWNEEIVQKWKGEGVEYIAVISPWEGRTYFTTVKTFFEKCILIDRGWGRQFALPERYWEILQGCGIPERFIKERNRRKQLIA